MTDRRGDEKSSWGWAPGQAAHQDEGRRTDAEAKPGKVRRMITEAELAEFRSGVGEWSARLGLDDWQITVMAGPMEGAMAQYCSDHEARKATLTITDVFDEDLFQGPLEPRKRALHEVLELLLMPFEVMLRRAPNDEVLVVGERHAVIHRLMRAFERMDG